MVQSAKGQKKKPNNLFGFFFNYQITIILLVLLITLVRQSFLTNNFPFVLYDKQQIINQNISINQTLDEKNKQLSVELKAESEANLEILESIARYKFGLLKKGERYYQISQSR
ncbi:cell division protein FtsB [Isorropodon fossajaponicum endosymbiont JTNG4]|uniref:cell division protein FtsB n=1 Tax=Isorropodon fossajaponicum symbiont TaxID=883811 RepID=UPI0019390CDF|nr:cell division protein FtsB [Isorropodon fossajaponicum symbiont]BBB23530.1 cell division protein FtsB [Isorropodon fossajaponicum endosymbiont JTNG4]